MKKISYEGQIVNLGIDVHKKSYKVCAMVDTEIVKKWTCVARPSELAESVIRFFQGAEIRSAYEAGFCGFSLHRVLVAAGFNNIVVNPASIEVAANDRVKTDKRDAKRIAQQLSVGKLRGIYVPSVEEELRRLLPRTREQLVEQRTATGNQIKSKLYQFGLIDPGDERLMSSSYLKWIHELSLPAELKLVLKELSDEWHSLSARIKRLDQELVAQAKSEPERERILRSAPGIGPITSRVLSAELGDMSRFPSEKALFSYTGMTPSEFSSGENVRRGHISHQGPARLRDVLIEATWRAIDLDADLRAIYERIKARRGGKIAIVGVARRLIGRIRGCLRRKVDYQYRIPVPAS